MQTVTLELPDALYRLAHRMAEATGQSLETVLQHSIAQALPPLDDVPPEEVEDLAALSLLDDAALWREAEQVMDEASQTELHDLLDRQGAGELSPAEQIRLQALMDLYGKLMVRKAHAWLLLARRGYRVPVQQTQS